MTKYRTLSLLLALGAVSAVEPHDVPHLPESETPGAGHGPDPRVVAAIAAHQHPAPVPFTVAGQDTPAPVQVSVPVPQAAPMQVQASGAQPGGIVPTVSETHTNAVKDAIYGFLFGNKTAQQARDAISNTIYDLIQNSEALGSKYLPPLLQKIVSAALDSPFANDFERKQISDRVADLILSALS